MSLELQIKASLYKQAIEKITGIPVQVQLIGDNKARIYWTKENAFLLRNSINNLLNKDRKPSDIDIDIEPAIRPLYIERLAPYVILLLGLGLASGIIIGRYL